MAFTTEQTASIESSMADFLTKRRPPEEIRDKLDLAWRIEGQSVVIYSIRPFWREKSQKIGEPAAKATYNRKTNRWKIYWMRADLKWHSYPPHPEAVFSMSSSLLWTRTRTAVSGAKTRAAFERRTG